MIVVHLRKRFSVLLIKLIIFFCHRLLIHCFSFSVRFTLKFYFILQISFWVHCFPELYFTRAKRVRVSYAKPRLCDRGCEIIISCILREKCFTGYNLCILIWSWFFNFDRRRFFQRFSYTLNIWFSSGLPTCWSKFFRMYCCQTSTQ